MRYIMLAPFLLTFYLSFAQVVGKVTYTLSLNEKQAIKLINDNKRGNSSSNEFILKQINEFEEVNTELNFSEYESIYKEVDILESDRSKSFNLLEAKAGGKSTFYSNISNELYFYTSKFSSKELVVYQKYKWEIKNKTKIILGFECQKAEIISQDDKKRVAWFTKEIPLPFGPYRYHGLPGLVLLYEEDEGLLILKAVSISFDDEIEINKPEGELIDEETHKEKLKKNSPLFKN